MRILVCGDRNWQSQQSIINELRKFPDDTVVIEGEAPGADTMARLAAEQLGFEVRRFPANWKKYGRAAGPIRNREMLNKGKPDLVLAFHKDITKSRGTADMVRAARKANIEIRLIRK